MLYVGLAGRESDRSVIASRLVELGAVRSHIDSGPPPWDVSAPAIVVLGGGPEPGADHWPGLHMVIAGGVAGDLRRGEELPGAGSPGKDPAPAAAPDAWLDLDGPGGGQPAGSMPCGPTGSCRSRPTCVPGGERRAVARPSWPAPIRDGPGRPLA